MTADAATGALERAPGDVLDGRYRLVRRLGRGGFGDVWQAEELLPGGAAFRDVALKLLYSGVPDAEFWAEEAKLLASFRHPSLVTVYAAGILVSSAPDAGPPVESPYVAMELLSGVTLADALRTRRSVPWRRVLRWARDVAAALDVIHRRGVVHLDLKPANLFLTDEGALKVLDFGIAKRSGDLPRSLLGRVPRKPPEVDAEIGTAEFVAENEAFAATRRAEDHTERAVVGTPGFMAPEIFERGEPTAATDAYALAVCLVQLATGKLPHAVDDEPATWDPTLVSAWWAEVRRATLTGALRDLASDPAQLPRALLALIERLLAVDPAARRVKPGRLFEAFDEVWRRPHGVARPPYPGRRELGPEDEGMLFGRDDDVDRLGRELEFEACVVLQGPPRAGKTSLAVAGLVPHLARRAADAKDDWIAVRVKPSASPDDWLAFALSLAAPDLEGTSVAEIAAWCEASPVGLALVVDPLEDLVRAAPERSARLAELLTGAGRGQPMPGLRVIGVIDDESTPELLASRLGASLRAMLRFVGAPPATAAAELVQRPAELAGAKIDDPGPIEADVRRELHAGGLVFAALALRTAWDERERGSAELSSASWRALGGVRGALARHGGGVMSAMDTDARRAASELLLRLSTTEGARVDWAEDELLESLGAGTAAREVTTRALSALIAGDLVQRRGGRVGIAHEALLTEWPELVTARLAAMDRVVFRDNLREAALAWERAGEPRDLLWSGHLLREAARHRGSLEGGVSPRERDFLRESRRRERRRSYAKVAAFAVLGITAAATITANRAIERREQEAEARRRAAEEQRYVAEVVARSRRTEDPFLRAAWIGEAAAKGSTDGMLALDLARAVAGVPRAAFLTLEPVNGASFPWGDRWLVARGSGSTLSLVDLRPSDSEIIEGIDLDFDPARIRLAQAKAPRSTSLRPHADAIADMVPFAFDTSFVTRSVTGEVRAFRLLEDGTPALAAIAPMRCTGTLFAARSAPVVACGTDDGIARWDLKRSLAGAGDDVQTQPFQGVVLDISADGARVAAALGRRILMWAPDVGATAEFQAEQPVVLGRWSPRDAILALVEPGRFEIVDPAHAEKPLMREESDHAPADARWAPGWLDLAVCSADGAGLWHYLRRGARAPVDTAPEPSATPCAEPRGEHDPRPIQSAADLGAFAERDVGAHALTGGFRLPDGRAVSRDLVLFGSSNLAADRLLRFHGLSATGTIEPYGPTDSIAAVARDGKDLVAFEIGGEVRLYRETDRQRVLARKGHLLGACEDGRLLAWRAEGDAWSLFEARSGSDVKTLRREPGFMLGADGACRTVYTQRLDGAIVATSLAADGDEPRVIAQADGYVYAVQRSRGGGDVGPGLLFAASSGAIARVDDLTRSVRVYAYATPRASALGDGPAPGDVAYADPSGIVITGASGASRRVLEATSGVIWEDLAVAPDGATMLLASADRLSVLDLSEGEIIGTLTDQRSGRLTPWDPEGAALLAWSFDEAGGPEGRIIPRGARRLQEIAAAVSNLTVEDGKLALRR